MRSFAPALLVCLPLLSAGCYEQGQTEIARGNVLASQRKLTEALARMQFGDLATLAGYFGFAIHDDEILAAHFAFGTQHLACFDRDVLATFGDEAQFFA